MKGGGQERRQAVRPRASQPCTVPPSLAQGGEQQQQRRRRQLEQVVLRSRFGPFSLVQDGDGQAERAETRSSASKARRRGGRNPGRGMRLAESPQSKRGKCARVRGIRAWLCLSLSSFRNLLAPRGSPPGVRRWRVPTRASPPGSSAAYLAAYLSRTVTLGLGRRQRGAWPARH